MTSYTRVSIAMATAAFVAGCGGSTKTVLNPGSNGLPYASAGAAVTVNTATNTYQGLDFLANSSRANYTKSGSTVTSSSTSLTGTKVNFVDANTARITLNGTPTTLARNGNGSLGGLSGPKFESGDTTAIFHFPGLSLFFGHISENASPPGADGAYADTFILTGLETNPDELTGLATANYSGPAYMIVRTSTDITDTGVHVIQNATATNLTANFGSGTVTGNIQGAVRFGLSNGANLQLDVTGGTISGNGFSGGLVKSGASDLNATNGQITGNFYGVNAAEIGGTISADLSGGSMPEPAAASGYFYGTKQ